MVDLSPISQSHVVQFLFAHEGFAECPTRIRNYNVGRIRSSRHRRDLIVQSCVIRNVTNEDFHVDAEAAPRNFFGDLSQSLLTPGDEDEVDTAGGESTRSGFANARRCSSDERLASSERLQAKVKTRIKEGIERLRWNASRQRRGRGYDLQ